MCRGFVFWALLAAALLLASALPASAGMDAESADSKLLAAVKAAAEKGIEPGKIEAAVGTKATLNTLREVDRDAFSRADIAEDPGRKPALPARDSLRCVVYWVRPIDSKNPKIVGVCWPKEGRPRLFYGEVLPPG